MDTDLHILAVRETDLGCKGVGIGLEVFAGGHQVAQCGDGVGAGFDVAFGFTWGFVLIHCGNVDCRTGWTLLSDRRREMRLYAQN